MEPKREATPPRVPLLPRELPFEHTELEALGGHIGPDPEDFRVDEVPLYAASGQGEHWYVRVKKRMATTAELQGALSEASGVPQRDIGYAGMKDKHAVTTQWLSIPAPRARPPAEWELPDRFELLEATRHANKLRLGHLAANRFRIRLVNVDAGAEGRIGPLAARISAAGIGNYFGSQRFGNGQRNLESALFALSRRRLGPRAGQRGRFLCSVIQSEIFNRFLIARSELGRHRVLAGDVARLEGSHSLFLVDDPETEQPRLDAGDIHLTGPMVGPKMRPSSGRPHELEIEASMSLGLTEEALVELGRSAPGTRRDLVLRPTEMRHELEPDGSLILDFTLPAGAYASLIVRAFTRRDPWPLSDEDNATGSGTMEQVDD